jgi:hypothetical protein
MEPPKTDATKVEQAAAPSPKEAAQALDFLQGDLINLGLEFLRRNYLNVSAGTPESQAARDRLFDVRDSIMHRSGSLLWHLQVVHGQREAIRRKFANNPAACIEAFGSPIPALMHTQEQFFVFDDIIFNTLSLYDYLGSLVAAIYMREKGSLTWKGLVGISKRIPPLLAGDLPALVVQAHEGWMDTVSSCRNRLIHNEALSAEGESSLDVEKIKLTWRVWLPADLRNRLGPAIFQPSDDRLEVADASVALVLNAFECARSIVRAARETCPVSDPPWFRPEKTPP